jgi:hypothetical protein
VDHRGKQYAKKMEFKNRNSITGPTAAHDEQHEKMKNLCDMYNMKLVGSSKNKHVVAKDRTPTEARKASNSVYSDARHPSLTDK